MRLRRFPGSVLWSGLLAAAVVVVPAQPSRAFLGEQPVVAARLYGCNFSPYVDGQDPNFGAQISRAQVEARLQLIAPYCEWVRSFGSTRGLEHIPAAAKALGLKVAAGAWIGPDPVANALEIAGLNANLQAGLVDLAIVGSESLLRGDVTEAQLIAYINQVKQAIPGNIPVATADTYDVLLAHPAVIAAGSLVLPNIYSYWQGVSYANALCDTVAAYQQVVAAAGGRPVWISEVGWPSAGNDIGAAVPSAENAAGFFRRFVSWARGANVNFFYFTSLDESWKARYEGPQGAHWGFLDKNAVLKPGMESVFEGDVEPVSCDGTPGGAGDPELIFTYVPPYSFGTPFDVLEGQTWHVRPADFNVVIYIYVQAWGWVIKPTLALPLTRIQSDGSFSARIDTGGNDRYAVEVAAFLIPASYNPPLIEQAPTLPQQLYDASVAHLQMHRTPRSVSGRVSDQSGHAIPGMDVVRIGCSTSVTTTSMSGKYSFVDIPCAGPDTVTPVNGGYLFSPTSATIAPLAGNTVANFTAMSVADLSVDQSAPTHVPIDSPVSVTLSVVNAGPATATNVVVTISAVGPFSGIAATSSRGACTGATVVTCQLGALPQSAFDTIIVSLTPSAAGSVDITTTVVSNEGDANEGNNTHSLSMTSGFRPTIMAQPEGRAVAPGLIATLSVSALNATSYQWYSGTSGTTTAPISGATASTYVTPPVLETSGYWVRVSNAYGSIDSDTATVVSRRAQSDILWRHASGMNYLWLMNGTQRIGEGHLATVDPAWQIVGAGDYNGDGHTDILWRHTSGSNYMWLTNGTQRIGEAHVAAVDPAWQIVGNGDYNGDDHADILWRHSSGTNYLWLMNGTARIGEGHLAAVDPAWQIAATVDYDGDGRADILWRHNSSGMNYLWLMYGTTRIGEGFLATVAPEWQLAGAGDYNGDGRADILWRHSSGANYLWLMNGTTRVGEGHLAVVDPAWQIAGTGDYNGDGRADILWRHGSGSNYMWLMDGTQRIGEGHLATVDPAWQVIHPH
jgi:exo-beta-1,3-glucanase (GH17 family)